MQAANTTSEPVGSLAVALRHAERLIAADPALAQEQAGEILKVVPGHPQALLLLGQARRRGGDAIGARPVLARLCHAEPRWAEAHFELALALAALGESEMAIAALRRAAELKPDLTEAWRALADQLTAAGDAAGADRAYAQHIRASVNDPALMQAALALCAEDLPLAERLLREHLKARPTDVAAIRMLAELATRLGRHGDAEALLGRCLELAPSFAGARPPRSTYVNRYCSGSSSKRMKPATGR